MRVLIKDLVAFCARALSEHLDAGALHVSHLPQFGLHTRRCEVPRRGHLI